MVGQEKPSLTKIGRENLLVYHLAIDRLVGGKIPIRKTIGICKRGFPRYHKLFLESGNGKVIGGVTKTLQHMLPTI